MNNEISPQSDLGKMLLAIAQSVGSSDPQAFLTVNVANAIAQADAVTVPPTRTGIPVGPPQRMSVPGFCDLCGKPMPPGEEMFKFHGYSGPCPK